MHDVANTPSAKPMTIMLVMCQFEVGLLIPFCQMLIQFDQGRQIEPICLSDVQNRLLIVIVHAGIRTIARKPPLGLSPSVTLPPCARAMSRAMARPRPVPELSRFRASSSR